MSTDLWVLVETWRGVPVDAGLAVVTEARRLADACGGTVTAVAIGDDLGAVTERAAAAGATTVRCVTGGVYADYTTDAWTGALHALIEAHSPAALLLAGTAAGSDVAPRLAARLGAGLIADCSTLEIDAEGVLTATKSELGGTRLARCRAVGLPIVTIRPGVLPAAATDGGPAQVVAEQVPEPPARVTVLERGVAPAGGEVALEDARVVVSGGRAMGGPDAFGVLHDLAKAFGTGAAVGASRPAADAGWVPVHREIGVSGKKVAPDLYVACGISGASQHLAGMSGSGVVVAINTDPEAPIFGVADFGVVGDLFEVVPALAAALRERS